MVTTFYPPFNFGGDGIYVEALSRALAARGHEVTVVHCLDSFRIKSPHADLEGATDEICDGVRVLRLRSRFGWLSPLLTQQTGHPGLKASRLRKILDADFDVVHFHNVSLIGGPAVLALPAGRALKIMTVHEHWLLCATHIFWKNNEARCEIRECLSCSVKSKVPPQAWRWTGLVERSLGHLDAIIAPSRFTAELHRGIAGPTPVHVLPLFSRIRPPAGSNGTAANDRDHFLYVGRVTASKGLRPMLQQFARHRNLKIKVAGTGELLPALKAEFGACENIEFLGSVPADRLGMLYQRAIAVILPSLAPETFGLSVVEGMAFGTPPIVHDAGGCREIVEASAAGFVFSDFAELPPLMTRLQTDHALWRSLSGKASAAYAQRYTAERHVRDYLKLLDTVREPDLAQAQM